MTKGLARELAPDVLVNCVCPGVIENPPNPPFAKGGSSVSPPFVKGGKGGFDKRAINASLLKRPVRAEDVISAVIFLAKNEGMTGQAIFVDCGR
jgi:NAD(P)-dependent dehydrogenase (short-subunit alcohol dehydrogenase family)